MSTGVEYRPGNYSAPEERARVEEPEPVREEPTTKVEPAKRDGGVAEFTGSDRSNMWDSIRTDQEDDLDVPPTLRERLRGKNRD